MLRRGHRQGDVSHRDRTAATKSRRTRLPGLEPDRHDDERSRSRQASSPGCPATSTWRAPTTAIPLSIVAIVPGVAGPFDVGTIVVSLALRFNPVTAQAEADGSASDPIPHILKGIPLAGAGHQGQRRQARLDLQPDLLRTGGHGGNPLRRRPERLLDPRRLPLCPGRPLPGSRLRQPRLQALPAAEPQGRDQARQVPEGQRRIQAAARRRKPRRPRIAPAPLGVHRTGPLQDDLHQGAVLGRSGLRSPVPEGIGLRLGQGLHAAARRTARRTGPPRSSNHNLPDLVASLHGIADIEAVARIDSKNGGLRVSFSGLPDAPISKVIVSMQGGKKGLIVNSTDICRGTHRANAAYTAQSGKKFKASRRCGPVRAQHEEARQTPQAGRPPMTQSLDLSRGGLAKAALAACLLALSLLAFASSAPAATYEQTGVFAGSATPLTEEQIEADEEIQLGGTGGDGRQPQRRGRGAGGDGVCGDEHTAELGKGGEEPGWRCSSPSREAASNSSRAGRCSCSEGLRSLRARSADRRMAQVAEHPACPARANASNAKPSAIDVDQCDWRRLRLRRFQPAESPEHARQHEIVSYRPTAAKRSPASANWIGSGRRSPKARKGSTALRPPARAGGRRRRGTSTSTTKRRAAHSTTG